MTFPDFDPATGGYDAGPVGLPRFCTRCGAQLRVERRGTGAFHRLNGKPTAEEIRRCPNGGRWFDGHTSTGWFQLFWIPPRPKPSVPP